MARFHKYRINIYTTENGIGVDERVGGYRDVYRWTRDMLKGFSSPHHAIIRREDHTDRRRNIDSYIGSVIEARITLESD